MFRLIIVTLVFGLYVAAQPQHQCNNPNEEWTACGRRCGESCADQGRRIACPRLCTLKGGCSCKQGYARDTNGQCIPKDQCPSNGSPTSMGCLLGGVAALCNIDPCAMDACPGQPGAQCMADNCGGCKAMWILNAVDVTNQCHKCRSDEVYNKSGPSCPPICGDEVMDRICPNSFKSGCFCKGDLVRGPNNACVRREDCPGHSRRFPA